MRIKTGASADRKTAELVITDEANETASAKLVLNAEALDALIGQLTRLRSQVSPPVPDQPGDGVVSRMLHGPMRAGIDAATGLPSLSLRHPGLGWIDIVLDQTDSVTLVNQLQKATELAGRGSNSNN